MESCYIILTNKTNCIITDGGNLKWIVTLVMEMVNLNVRTVMGKKEKMMVVTTVREKVALDVTVVTVAVGLNRRESCA
ncbi:hypothetical protein [Guptibacillus sedimenti]|uniref:hypothetical protein n=1 Tax=Guptibacillus sedimenti TaxID=3025680 RepID=UPI00235EED90|nr:hypothetical protein [Pseudalkalibacillus sedimenti]